MPRHPRRISFLTTGLARGGAEVQVLLLAKGLKHRGWQVSVESLLPPQDFTGELAECGIPVISLDMRPGVPNPVAIWRLARHWRRFRPDVVHCHQVHANLLGRVTRLVAPARVLVATAHNTWEGPRWRDWAYRLTEPFGDLTTNVSQASLNRYLRDKVSSPSKSVWVPNGIDTGQFAPDPELRSRKRAQMGWEGSFVWLAVGNLRGPKDYPNLLRAFASAGGSNSARLAIAGSGDLLGPLQELARSLSIADRVEFLGSRPDVRELMQAADGFAMSSEWEGLPLALIEASASALPIVATAVGGNGEVVVEGRTGFLVPPRNSQALAQAMERLLALSPADRSRLGEAAKAHVAAYYGIERILSKWENIYEQLIEVTPRRRNTSGERAGWLREGLRAWRRN